MPSRLDELSKGRREYLQTVWPANPQLGRPEGIPVKLQVLNEEQFQDALSAAHERFREKKIPPDGMNADDFEGELQLQLLARACRDNDKPETVCFAMDAADLRRNTTPWERAEVARDWALFQERRNPMHALLPEERAQVLDAVKKKDATSLRGFGVDSLVSYLLTSDSPQST
jgi:hypothetical protein